MGRVQELKVFVSDFRNWKRDWKILIVISQLSDQKTIVRHFVGDSMLLIDTTRPVAR